jgi:hypothetical protein
MQTKIYLNQLTIQEVKKIQKSKKIMDSFSNKHSGSISGDYTLVTKSKSKTCKIYNENFQFLKINKMEASNS